MAITEQQQLIYIKSKFCVKVNAQETMAEMLDFINNITPANVRTFLQNRLQEMVDSTRIQAGNLGTLADDIETLKDSL